VAHWLRDRGSRHTRYGWIAALTGEGLDAEPVPAEEATPTPPARVLAALRWPLCRRYSAGVLLSLIGNWVEAAAYGYVVLLLGGSAATLGLIGFLNTIPNLVFALPAGALADRYDRRKLLLIFQSLNMALAAALAVTWATGTLTVGLLGVLAVLGGILGTLSFAPFQAMLAAMVPRRDLESAVAINSLSLQVARFVGPAIAGFLLAVAGPTWVFGVNAVSFVAVLGTLALLPGSHPVRRAAVMGGGAIAEAFRYVFGQRSLAAMMGLMLVAGLFGTPPVAFMIPAIVRYNLHAGAGTLGAITAAIGLGSLLGSIALLRLSGRPNKGEPLLVGFVVTGAALAGIGASTNTWLSLALAFVTTRRRPLCRVVHRGGAGNEQRRGRARRSRSGRQHSSARSPFGAADRRPGGSDRPGRRRLRRWRGGGRRAAAGSTRPHDAWLCAGPEPDTGLTRWALDVERRAGTT
jgi:MFS family permease